MRAYFAQLGTSRQAKAAENLTTSLKTGAPGMGDPGHPIRRWEAHQEFLCKLCRNLDKVCANFSGQTTKQCKDRSQIRAHQSLAIHPGG
jgi:hypothetical protein